MSDSTAIRRYLAIVLTLMFLLPFPLGLLQTQNVSAGTATITSFDGDITTKTLDFRASKINDTLGFKVPKASRVSSASVDLKAVMVGAPGKVTLDTKDEFLGAKPIRLELNKTWGNAEIIERTNISDEFNDGALDLVNWSWTNPPATVNENIGTGQLEITANGNTNWSGTTQTGSYLSRPVDGNFMLIAKLSCSPDANQESCGIMLYQNTDNWFQEVLKWRKYGNNGGNFITYKQRKGGSTANDERIAYNANPLYIKITRYGDQFTIYYSNNDIVFTQHKQFNWSMGQPVMLGPIVYSGLESANTFRADYDYLRISRYLENATLSVGPIITPYPVSRFTMTPDLRQLEIWETFKLLIRANDTGPVETFTSGGDYMLNVPGNKVNMTVLIDGKGWTTPLLRSVVIDYYPESWPSKLTMDVGNDGSVDWWYNQSFSITATVSSSEFVKALDALKDAGTPDGSGFVHIPMRMTSQTPGQITFQNLKINLVTGSPPKAPTLKSPANNIWIGTYTPSFEFTTTDPDSDTIQYQVEVSEDNFATIKYTFDQKMDLYGWSAGLYNSGEDGKFTMDLTKPLEQGKTYQWRVRASDNAWWSNYSEVRVIKVDVTPPDGAITDAGTSTAVNREADATVLYTDAESGVAYAECGLGTAKDKTDVVPMTPVNLTTNKVHFTNLTLENLKLYYFIARSRNNAGVWSNNITSDGVRIDLSLDDPPEVNVMSPANRTMVDGIVEISGTSFDKNAQDTVTVWVEIDDGLWVQALGSTMWSLDWDTKKVADGEHYIFVKAFDGMRESPVVQLRVVVGNNRMTIIDWTPKTDPTINETETIEFTVELRDPAKIFKSYTWSIDGVNVPNSDKKNFTLTATYTDAGVKVIEVKAMGVSMSESHKWNLTINNINRDPKAIIAFPENKASLELGKSTLFDGSTSSDPDNEGLTYSWTFSDGTTATGDKVDKKFKKEGSFTAKLVVKDKYDATSEAQVTVNVYKKVDIAGQITTFPFVLILLLPIFLVVGIGAFYVFRKNKQAKDFQKKVDTQIDQSSLDDLLAYNPAPKDPGAGMTTQQTAPGTDQQQYQQPPAGDAGQYQQPPTGDAGQYQQPQQYPPEQQPPQQQ